MRFLSIFFVLFCMSCEPSASNPKGVANVPVSSISIIDYGEGVYYFPYTRQAFANALASFLRKNSSLQVTAMAGDGTAGYGADQGYFVTFQVKTAAESDATIHPVLMPTARPH